MSSYQLHPEAYIDIDEIRDYISYDSLEAARHVVAQIFKAIEGLVPLPNKGHRRTDLTTRPLRFWWVGQYLIAYAPEQ